jgi:hypothetical protein
MQKQNYGITSPGALFVESEPVPPEHEKLCVDVSRHRCIRMHYVIHRSHQMQKHKFCVMCLGDDSLNPYRSHPNMKIVP